MNAILNENHRGFRKPTQCRKRWQVWELQPLSRNVHKSNYVQNKQNSDALKNIDTSKCWNKKTQLIKNHLKRVHYKNQNIFYKTMTGNIPGLTWWVSGKAPTYQCKRHGFEPCGQEDSLEKEMTIHSNILAWAIPQTEESGRLYSSWGHKRVGHDLATQQHSTPINIQNTMRG